MANRPETLARCGTLVFSPAMLGITGQAKLAGVIGWPVAHSRSPRLHNHWLARYGIDGAYVPLAVHPGQFTTAVRGLVAAGFAGANVTVPHKVAALSMCDEVAPNAQQAGAVNTLVFGEDGRIHGSNTDGAGFLANLRAHGVDPAVGPALLLGAGGAARAIAAALLAEGVSVSVANRSADRARGLAADLPGLCILRWDAREAAVADHALLVNTTTLGMEHHPALALDLARASASLAVADIVYVPQDTPLLAEARFRGLRAIPGLGMLLHQAVPGFAAWFGVTPEVDRATWETMAADLK